MRTSAILPEGAAAAPFQPSRRSRQPQMPSLVAEMTEAQPTPAEDYRQRAYMARQIQSQEDDAKRADAEQDKAYAAQQKVDKELALDTENSAALSKFKETGEQYYSDPLTKKIVGTGAFTKKILPDEVDPVTGYPLKVAKVQGQVVKTPNVAYGTDPATGEFVSKNKTTGEVIRKEDIEKAAISPNAKESRPAVTRLFQQEEGKQTLAKHKLEIQQKQLGLESERIRSQFADAFHGVNQGSLVPEETLSSYTVGTPEYNAIARHNAIITTSLKLKEQQIGIEDQLGNLKGKDASGWFNQRQQALKQEQKAAAKPVPATQPATGGSTAVVAPKDVAPPSTGQAEPIDGVSSPTYPESYGNPASYTGKPVTLMDLQANETKKNDLRTGLETPSTNLADKQLHVAAVQQAESDQANLIAQHEADKAAEKAQRNKVLADIEAKDPISRAAGLGARITAVNEATEKEAMQIATLPDGPEKQAAIDNLLTKAEKQHAAIQGDVQTKRKSLYELFDSFEAPAKRAEALAKINSTMTEGNRKALQNAYDDAEWDRADKDKSLPDNLAKAFRNRPSVPAMDGDNGEVMTMADAKAISAETGVPVEDVKKSHLDYRKARFAGSFSTDTAQKLSDGTVVINPSAVWKDKDIEEAMNSVSDATPEARQAAKAQIMQMRDDPAVQRSMADALNNAYPTAWPKYMADHASEPMRKVVEGFREQERLDKGKWEDFVGLHWLPTSGRGVFDKVAMGALGGLGGIADQGLGTLSFLGMKSAGKEALKAREIMQPVADALETQNAALGSVSKMGVEMLPMMMLTGPISAGLRGMGLGTKAATAATGEFGAALKETQAIASEVGNMGAKEFSASLATHGMKPALANQVAKLWEAGNYGGIYKLGVSASEAAGMSAPMRTALFMTSAMQTTGATMGDATTAYAEKFRKELIGDRAIDQIPADELNAINEQAMDKAIGTSRIAAGLSGVITGTLSTLMPGGAEVLGQLGSKAGYLSAPASLIMQRVGAKKLAEYLESGTVKAALANAAATVGLGVVGEMGQEFADQLGSGIIAKMSYEPKKTFGQIIEEAVEAGLLASLMGGVGGAVQGAGAYKESRANALPPSDQGPEAEMAPEEPIDPTPPLPEEIAAAEHEVESVQDEEAKNDVAALLGGEITEVSPETKAILAETAPKAAEVVAKVEAQNQLEQAAIDEVPPTDTRVEPQNAQQATPENQPENTPSPIIGQGVDTATEPVRPVEVRGDVVSDQPAGGLGEPAVSVSRATEGTGVEAPKMTDPAPEVDPFGEDFPTTAEVEQPVTNPAEQNEPINQTAIQQEQGGGQDVPKPREMPVLPQEPGAQAETPVADGGKVESKLRQPTADDYADYTKFPGVHYAATPNKVVIQVRGLDVNPIGRGIPIELPVQDTLEATAKMVHSGYVRLIDNVSSNASLRESVVHIIGPDGRAIMQLFYAPNGMEMRPLVAPSAQKTNTLPTSKENVSAPKPEATAKDQSAKPAKAPKLSPDSGEALKQAFLEAAGKDAELPHVQRASNVLKAEFDRWKAILNRFTKSKMADNGGMALNDPAKGLMFDAAKVAKTVRNLNQFGDDTGRWVKSAIQEEVIHYLAKELEGDGTNGVWSATKLWGELSEDMKARVRAARPKEIQNESDFSLGHEFMRMLVQGEIDQNELTELTATGLKQVHNALKALVKYFSELISQLTVPSEIKKAKEVRDLIIKRMRAVEGTMKQQILMDVPKAKREGMALRSAMERRLDVLQAKRDKIEANTDYTDAKKATDSKKAKINSEIDRLQSIVDKIERDGWNDDFTKEEEAAWTKATDDKILPYGKRIAALERTWAYLDSDVSPKIAVIDKAIRGIEAKLEAMAKAEIAQRGGKIGEKTLEMPMRSSFKSDKIAAQIAEDQALVEVRDLMSKQKPIPAELAKKAGTSSMQGYRKDGDTWIYGNKAPTETAKSKSDPSQRGESSKGLPLSQSDKSTVTLPCNENIKIAPATAGVFKARIAIVADSVEQIRPGEDGIIRLMETAMNGKGVHEAIAFREWLLRQKGLTDRAKQALLGYSLPKSEVDAYLNPPKNLSTETAKSNEIQSQVIEKPAPEAKGEAPKKEFSYGMKARPFSIGAQPKGHSGIDESDKRARWGVVKYPRKLTADEVRSFELVSLPDSDQPSGNDFPSTGVEPALTKLSDKDTKEARMVKLFGGHLKTDKNYIPDLLEKAKRTADKEKASGELLDQYGEFRLSALKGHQDELATSLMANLGIPFGRAQALVKKLLSGETTVLDKIAETKPVRKTELTQSGIYPSELTSRGYEQTKPNLYVYKPNESGDAIATTQTPTTSTEEFSPARDASKPEQMSPEEVVARYGSAYGDGEAIKQARLAVKEAVKGKFRVNAAFVDAYKITLPSGYVRKGELYVYESPRTETAPKQADEKQAEANAKTKGQQEKDVLVTSQPSPEQSGAGNVVEPSSEKVVKAAEKAANKPDLSPVKMSAQKKYLIDAIAEAIKDAPAKSPKVDADAEIELFQEALKKGGLPVALVKKYQIPEGEKARKTLENKLLIARQKQLPKVVIEVPGDGVFSIVNTKSALTKLAKRAKAFPVKETVFTDPSEPSRPSVIPALGSSKKMKFKDFVKVAGLAVSDDPTKDVLSDVFSDGISLVATDGKMLMEIKNPDSDGVLIDPINLDPSTGSAIKTKGRIPLWKQVIPSTFGAKHEVDTGVLYKLLVQASKMLGLSERMLKDNTVELWADADGKIGVTSISGDGDTYAGGSDPETSKFLGSYNPERLMVGLKAARMIGLESVTLNAPKDSAMMITGENMRFVLMPTRSEIAVHPESGIQEVKSLGPQSMVKRDNGLKQSSDQLNAAEVPESGVVVNGNGSVEYDSRAGFSVATQKNAASDFSDAAIPSRAGKGSPILEESGHPREGGEKVGPSTGQVSAGEDLVKIDEDYFKAIEAGSLDRAQSLVDKALKMAGYTIATHGTDAKGVNGIRSEGFDRSKRGQNTGANSAGKAVFLALTPSLRLAWGANIEDWAYTKAFEAFEKEWTEENGEDFFDPTREQVPDNVASNILTELQEEDLLTEFRAAVKTANFAQVDYGGKSTAAGGFSAMLQEYIDAGFDGVKIENVKDPAMGDMLVVFDESKIKSAELKTYDESGNVIPLSQRFNPKSDSILNTPEVPESDPMKAEREKIISQIPGTKLKQPSKDALITLLNGVGSNNNIQKAFNQLLKDGVDKKLASSYVLHIKKFLPAPVETGSVGTKFASMEESRKNRGEVPLFNTPETPDGIIKLFTQSNQETLDIAKQRLSTDPKAGEKLRDRLIKGDRQTDRNDGSILMLEIGRIRNERNKQADIANSPTASARDKAEAWDSLLELEAELTQYEIAQKHLGTNAGGALQAIQAMMKLDFSLDAMQRRMRVAKGGKALTKEEIEQTEATDKALTELRAKLEAKEAAYQEELYKLRTEHNMEMIKANERVMSPADAALLAKISSRLTSSMGDDEAYFSEQLNTPEIPSLDERIVSYAAKMRVKGADSSEAMRKMFAENVSEKAAAKFDGQWETIFNQSESALDAMLDKELGKSNASESSKKEVKQRIKKDDFNGMRKNISDRIAQRVKDGDELEDLRPFVQQLAITLVRQGYDKPETLWPVVKQELQKHLPDVTDQQTKDLISGYGDYRTLDPEPAKATLRGIKGVYQQLAKISGMMSKIAPKATGVERRQVTDEERRLIKQVNDLKKKFSKEGWMNSGDDSLRLKGLQQSIQARLKNEIRDMDLAIAKNQPIVREMGAVEYSEETKVLKTLRDAKKAEYDALFPKQEMTEEQRTAALDKHLERSIKKLEDDLSTGKLFADSKKPVQTTPEIESKKQQLQQLRDERDALRKLDTLRIENRKIAMVQKQINTVEEQIANKDISTKPKGAPDLPAVAALKKELAALKQKRSDMREAIAPYREQARLAAKKASLSSRMAELTARLASDTPDKPTKAKMTKAAVKLDQEADAINQKIKDLEGDIKDKLVQLEYDRMNKFQKSMAMLNAINRGSILSGINTLQKLSGAGIENIFTRPFHTVAAQFMKLVGMNRILEKAVVEGGTMTLPQEFRNIIKDPLLRFSSIKAVWDKIKTGKSAIDKVDAYRVGEVNPFGGLQTPVQWLENLMGATATARYKSIGGLAAKVLNTLTELPGHIHGAIKEPVRQAIFIRTYALGAAEALKNGIDITTDKQERNRVEIMALAQANRDIFMGGNLLTEAIRGATQRLRHHKNHPKAGSFMADVIEFLLPIIGVPTNLAIRKARHLFGIPEAVLRAAQAGMKGDLTKKMNPETGKMDISISAEDADLITRSFKYGLVGLALALYAWNNDDEFGGVYAPGSGPKRDKNSKMKPGDMNLFSDEKGEGGLKINHLLGHGPWGSFMNLIADAKKLVRESEEAGQRDLSNAAFFTIYAGLMDLPIFSTFTRLGSPFKTASEKAGDIVAGTFVPQGLKDLAVASDPLSGHHGESGRDPQGFMDAIKMKIPGLREEVKAKQTGTSAAGLSDTYIKVDGKVPAWVEILAKYNVANEKDAWTPGRSVKTITIKGENYTMTAAQFQKFDERQKDILNKRLAGINPNAPPTKALVDRIKNAREEAGRQARGEIWREMKAKP